MTEREDVQEDLSAAGVLDVLRWSFESARRRALQDFDPETGYDQAWFGMTRYKLMVDRLDRCFSSGNYVVGDDFAPESGLDVLGAGLMPGELDVMPMLDPEVVRRDDLNGSPGWRAGRWRFLLAAAQYGQASKIAWGQKSPTKRRVAAQPGPDQMMLPLEDVPALFEELKSSRAVEAQLAVPTLVLAHGLDAETGAAELLLGRPRLDDAGMPPWWWTINLLTAPPSGGGERITDLRPQGSGGGAAAPVEDAPVFLRGTERRDERRDKGRDKGRSA